MENIIPNNGGVKVSVVSYVRMSTDHQRYSIENQKYTISDYARNHGMNVIKTYSDTGRTGLSIKGRKGLRNLLDIVESGSADFKAILVYDISRWGRFQDADESAYYEYICTRAGILVHYCAEEFDNNGSPISTIIKGVKRAMAGEYSRELSVKVFAGQSRPVERWYWQGGNAGYGLRRMLVDENDKPKQTLERGQQKFIQSDRVILVPGPKEEIDIVNQMYNLFADKIKTAREIAKWLNGTGIKTDRNVPWTTKTVLNVLSNEKYIGNNVFNRYSFKLKKRSVKNDQDMWIRAIKVFKPIVTDVLFNKVQN
ncbi:MAG: recombinase family protein [Emcibacteraceae bacterium]|nr:recombinase family protein [Emcibacteraceae bacterium]